MNEERETAVEAQQQILATPLDREDAIPLELLGYLEQVVGPCEARIEDLDPRERPTFESRRELLTDRLDLRKLGHVSTVLG
jgi:hypothetical protein